MESQRQQKVSKLIQKEVSDIFQKEARHLCQNKMLTVTVVRVSPDLGQAKIYLSVFPSEGLKEVVENISENAWSVRYELGKRVRHQMRVIPELHFFADDSLDYIENIDSILKK